MKYSKLNEFANISPKITGFNNIFICLVPITEEHWYRIKVCNIYGKYRNDDVFIITIPDLKVEGNVKIKQKELDEIIDFISKFKDAIIELEKMTIDKYDFYDVVNGDIELDVLLNIKKNK